MTALVLVGLLSFSALAVDLGLLMFRKRAAQLAADAAALAGAQEIFRGTTSNVITAAKEAAALNRFTDGANGVTIRVAYPPATGLYAGRSTHLQVVVSEARSTLFARSFGTASMAVAASASAGIEAGASGCVYALAPTRVDTIRVEGGSRLQANCGILSDSVSTQGLYSTGQMIGSMIGAVAAGYQGTGYSPVPTTGIPAFGDPLAYLPLPTTAAACSPGFTVPADTTRTINPGRYCGTIVVGEKATLRLNPGMYFLEGGGLDTKGMSTLSGTGVTIVRRGSGSTGMLFESKSNVFLSAPNASTRYDVGAEPGIEGILWFSRGGAAVLNDIQSESNVKLEGVVYTPAQEVRFQGRSATGVNAASYTGIVAYNLRVEGSSVFGLASDYSSLSNGSPFKRVTLSE
ncbi:MAG: hypothetical protein HY821_15325 [Acidobacteria bacterium]|nr:hypothetical protein [Acidobacteriota bacterium]